MIIFTYTAWVNSFDMYLSLNPTTILLSYNFIVCNNRSLTWEVNYIRVALSFDIFPVDGKTLSKSQWRLLFYSLSAVKSENKIFILPDFKTYWL